MYGRSREVELVGELVAVVAGHTVAWVPAAALVEVWAARQGVVGRDNVPLQERVVGHCTPCPENYDYYLYHWQADCYHSPWLLRAPDRMVVTHYYWMA